ncbi:uncharacterized protein CCOS01_13718 [Colletotrichum costaricense]|uniref:Uncharacterized protein n=1 Tax=Colletotrichum costaricense TaxID=1209916 RepID=A0AAI9YLB5_9PEZI|nr:uncharacterized protein CCOS01_13718 [Colletotrichum costaricense]KAK1514437.1 hypothetical protein CCOS01_13718 [Colletotrichum costaricense]
MVSKKLRRRVKGEAQKLRRFCAEHEVGQAWMRYKAEVDAISMARNLARLDLGNDTKAIEETGAEQSSLPSSRPKNKTQRQATRRRIHYKEDTDGDISSDEGEDDDDDEDDDQSTVTEAITDDGMTREQDDDDNQVLFMEVSDDEDGDDDEEYEDDEMLDASSVDSFMEEDEAEVEDITASEKVFFDIDEGFAAQKRKGEEQRAARNEDKKARRAKKRKLAQEVCSPPGSDTMTDDGNSLSSLAAGEDYTAEELDDAQNQLNNQKSYALMPTRTRK